MASAVLSDRRALPTTTQPRSVKLTFIVLTGWASSGLLIYGHATYIGPVFGYLGMPYTAMSYEEYLQLFVLIAISALFLPLKWTQVADFLVWLIFFFTYIPSITMTASMGILSSSSTLFLESSLTIGFCLLAWIATIQVEPFKPVRVRRTEFWIFLLTLAFWLLLWIIAQNHTTMNIVSVDDIYTQRFAGAETVGASAYAMGIIGNTVAPFLMSYGIYKKKLLVVAGAILAEVIVYSVQAQKFVLLSVLYIPAFYFLLGGRKNLDEPRRVPISRAGMVALGLLVFSVFVSIGRTQEDVVAGGVLQRACDIVLVRLFALPGALVAQYANFFEYYPITYFAHVGIGKFFMTSPYLREVSLEVGAFLANGLTGMNANANTFASDGVTSFGLIGPVVAGVLVGLVLSLLNRFAGRNETPLLAIASAPFVFAIGETSVFTSLLTGGGVMTMIVLYLYRSGCESSAPLTSEKRPNIRATSSARPFV